MNSIIFFRTRMQMTSGTAWLVSGIIFSTFQMQHLLTVKAPFDVIYVIRDVQIMHITIIFNDTSSFFYAMYLLQNDHYLTSYIF